MNTGALIMMVVAFAVVTFMTIYYFAKVLSVKPKDPKHDSYTETN